MRAFLGVPLPATLCEELARAAGRIEGLRAQKPSTIHLTIRFLGEIDDPEAVADAVAPVAAAHDPFDIILKGLGAFPSVRSARVVWVGLQKGDLPAGALAKGVDNALAALGFARERRPFRGHITLGRFRRPRRLTLPDARSFGAARADRLTLYSSVLTPEGARHDPLREMSLGRGK